MKIVYQDQPVGEVKRYRKSTVVRVSAHNGAVEFWRKDGYTMTWGWEYPTSTARKYSNVSQASQRRLEDVANDLIDSGKTGVWVHTKGFELEL